MRILIFLLVLLASNTSSSEVLFNISGAGTIYSAVDGDTFWVNLDSKKNFTDLYHHSRDDRHFRPKYLAVKMRLGNTNTEESNHKDSSRNTPKGRATSEYVKSFTEKRRVKFHCWDIGDYNRPICSIRVQGLGDIGLLLIQKNLSPYVRKYGDSPRMHREYMEAAIK